MISPADVDALAAETDDEDSVRREAALAVAAALAVVAAALIARHRGSSGLEPPF